MRELRLERRDATGVPAIADTLVQHPIRVEWLASLAIAALAIATITAHALVYTTVSPIDEFQHIDYLYRAADFELVRAGDRAGPEVFREIEVRGLDAVGLTQGFYNTAYVHPPSYYVVTAQAAKLVQALTGLESLVSGARLFGAAWLAGGLILLWHAARACGASRMATAGVVLLIGSSPGLLHATATVNPDGTSLLCGGLALFALVVWERRRGAGLALMFLAGLTSTAFKYTNAVVVLLLGAYLLWLAVRREAEDVDSERPWWRLRAPAMQAIGVLGVGALIPLVTWTLAVGALARVDPGDLPQSEQFVAESLEFSNVIGNATQFLTPLTGSHVPNRIQEPEINTARALSGWLLGLGAFGVVLLGRSRDARDRFASLLVAVLIAAPPLLVVVTYLQYGAYFRIPSRYGLALVPALGLVLALTAQTTRARRLLAAVGAVTAIAVVAALLRQVPQ